MCGIVGIVDFGVHGRSNRHALARMISTLNHRGPDGWGVFTGPAVALGHTRLSIMDLVTGDQPMMTERFAIVYNGEVYNYLELRTELEGRGACFATTSDTEVVLRAFEVLGTDAFARFNGQFAVAIWDRRERRLVLVRDRYGVRPLYVLRRANAFLFSSEMKAFDTVDGYQRAYDMQHLYEHALLWNTLRDDTVYQGIRSVQPGTFEVYEEGQDPKVVRYYELGETFDGGAPRADLSAAREEFAALLEDAVSLRLRSDVPVGAYLSGGIDSSVIAYLTSRCKGDKLSTFSIAFEDREFDESDYQQEMVARLDVDHCSILVDYRSINDTFPKAVYHFERPVFRTAPVPLCLLSEQVAARGVKVVLTGEGADEILFGYDSYKELRLLEAWRKDPDSAEVSRILGDLYPHLSHYRDPQRLGMLRMFYEGFVADFDNELAGLNIRIHNNAAVGRFFQRDHDIVMDKGPLIEKIRTVLPDRFASWSLLQRNQFLEMKTLLSGYLLSSQGDRMSLAHGVEGRYPFLDHRLVEQVFSLPDALKLNDLNPKFLLKEAYRDQIPARIIQRPKRPYMAPDLKSFLHGGALGERSAHLLSPETVREHGVFDENAVARFLRKFRDGVPEALGYRDNMLITFLLSAQLASEWSRTPKVSLLREDTCKVDYDDS